MLFIYFLELSNLRNSSQPWRGECSYAIEYKEYQIYKKLEEKSKDKKNFNNFVTNLLAARYMAERLNAIKESEYNYSLILCVNIGDVYGKVISKYAQVSKEEFKSDYNQLKKEIKSQQIKETA